MPEILQKKTLNLRKGDWEAIDDILADSSMNTSKLIRKLVSKYVDKVRDRKASTEETSNLDIKL